MKYKIESLFEHKGLKCVVLLTSIGHRCGYVGVGNNSFFYGKKYYEDLKKPELLEKIRKEPIGKRNILNLLLWDRKKITPELLFDVHGGITYSDNKKDYPIVDHHLWWFGFDCNHCDDAKDWKTTKKNFPKEEWENYYKVDQMYPIQGIIRTKEYVEQECKNLAAQIKIIESL